MLCSACVRVNPLYEDADAAGGNSGSAGASGSNATVDDGETGADEAGGSGSGSTSSESQEVLLFATAPTNGSVGVDGGIEGLAGAAAMCQDTIVTQGVPCSDQPRPLLFDGPTDVSAQRLNLPENAPVVSLSGVLIAPTVNDFLAGPLDASLLGASVVLPGTAGVWTGLNDLAPSNCSRWTSGNEDRLGGSARTDSVAPGWMSETSRSCRAELPVLCLCR